MPAIAAVVRSCVAAAAATCAAVMMATIGGTACAGEVRVEKDVAFLGADRSEQADLYLPDPPEPGKKYPAIVVIHGGGWTRCDKADAREVNIASTLAAHGYVCMSINYRLATPDAPSFPANIHDVKRAVRWLRRNAERLHLDSRSIGAIGGSAGGHLTALLAVTGPESGLDPAEDAEVSCRIQAAVPLYPHCASTWEVGDPPTVSKAVPLFGTPRDEAPALWDSALPIKHVSADDPPLLLVHGTADKTTPMKQSTQLREAALAAGVPCELLVVEGAAHAFHLQPEQRDLRPEVVGFFDRHLKPRQ